MNMSYCRFHNTAIAFDDCADTLEDMMNADCERLSPEEVVAAKRLLKRAQATLADLAKFIGSEGEVLVEDDFDLAFEEIQRAIS